MSQTYVPGRVHVHGASLAGLAAAARLAKAGHEVVIDAAGLPDGGHWAARNHLGVSVDELPQTFLLPAAWRDLFKKSGRALDAELARHQLELVPAAGQLHRFADGAELLLPAERGAQFHAVAQAFGQSAAEAWTTLVDELDELWQRLRMAGLERPVTSHTFDRPTRAALLAERSIDELAQRAGDPHLACVVRAQAPICGAAPGRNPALLAVRLAVLRRFGSWQLVDTSGDRPRAQRPSRLLELLTERLQLRGVERVGAPTPLLGTGAPDLSRLQSRPEVPAEARLEALPVLPGPGFLGRRPARPAQAPSVNHRIVAAAGNLEDIAEVVDHCTGTPVVTWRRPLPPDKRRRCSQDGGMPASDSQPPNCCIASGVRARLR